MNFYNTEHENVKNEVIKTSFEHIQPFVFDEQVRKKLLSFCVYSKTSEDVCVLSIKKEHLYADYVAMAGFVVSYRIFTMMLLKGIFYNYTNNHQKWDEIEGDIQSLWKGLELSCREKDNYVFLLNIIRKKFKKISEESSLDDVCLFVDELENKFKHAREIAEEVMQ